MNDSNSERNPVDELAEEFVARYRKGERPSLTEYTQAHPELAAEIRDLFPALVMMEDVRPGDGHQTATAIRPAAGAGAPARGSRIGDYELLDELGRGGMGVVYKARQVSVNRLVALKLVRAGELASEAEVQRFRAEAEHTAQLDHPHIVPLYEVGDHQGQPFFTMKLLDGGTLGQHLDRFKDPRLAAALVAAVAGAVHHAHRHGILHRDLKPANILLDADNRPYVTDFGLARRVAGSAGLTQSGAIVGTPSYMAPEQARGERRGVTTAADVYALGALLYELLSGRPPFVGETPTDVLLRVLQEEPLPPSRLNPQAPRDLEVVCLKCLAKEPERRYASAEAVADELRRWLAGESIQARPVGRAERLFRWARRHPARAAVCGLLVLVLVLGAGAGGVAWLWREAVTARREAVRARDSEEQQRRVAEGAQAAAEKAQQGEAKERARAEGLLYFRRIDRAHIAWRENDLLRAEALLEACTPEQRRNWEWRYVHRLCHAELFTLQGHTQAVRGVAWSPDGSRLASAWPEEVIVWDARTREKVLTLGHRFVCPVVAWSPDGSRLATTTSGSRWGLGGPLEVIVWDAHTGQVALTLKCPERPHDLAWSPDGSRLAGALDTAVKVWDARTGQETMTLKWPTNLVLSVAWSPDGTHLGAGGGLGMGGGVKVWDAKTGQELVTLNGHMGWVWGVAFSPDGTRLASASGDGTAKIRDAGTGQEMLTLKGHTGAVYGVAWSPDGTRLASASGDAASHPTGDQWGIIQQILKPGEIRIWDAKSGQEIRTLKGHMGPVYGVAFSPDGTRLASASNDRTVKVWDTTREREALTITVSKRAPGKGGLGGEYVPGVAWSPDGTRLATGAQGQPVTVWDAHTGQKTLSLGGPAFGHVAWSPDGSYLAGSSIAGWDKQMGYVSRVKIWDARTGQEALTLGAWPLCPVDPLVWSPGGSRLAHAVDPDDNPGGVKVWDAKSGQEVLALNEHTGHIPCLAWSPDGTRLASASEGRTVKVWDGRTGQEALTLDGKVVYWGDVDAICWSLDSRRLTSVATNGTVKVWDAETGQEALTFKLQTGPLSSGMVWSPDRSRLAGCVDERVKVWDAETGQEALTLTGHSDRVLAVAWSPDGSRLASASADGTVKVWEATPLPEEIPGR
jgi:WD40 repeat protein